MSDRPEWCAECGMHTTHRCGRCGDALIWNYEFDSGLCYRCEDEEDESDDEPALTEKEEE